MPNRIRILSQVGKSSQGLEIGAQAKGLTEIWAASTLSALLEQELKARGIVEVVNEVSDGRMPAQTHHLENDIVIELAFPLVPKGQSYAWNTGTVTSNKSQPIAKGLTDALNKWGMITSLKWKSPTQQTFPVGGQKVRIVPFYLDGPDALIFAQRLGNLAWRFAEQICHDYQSERGLWLRLTPAPLGRIPK